MRRGKLTCCNVRVPKKHKQYEETSSNISAIHKSEVWTETEEYTPLKSGLRPQGIHPSEVWTETATNTPLCLFCSPLTKKNVVSNRE